MPLTKVYPIYNEKDFVSVNQYSPLDVIISEHDEIYKEQFKTSYLKPGSYNVFDLCVPKNAKKLNGYYIDPTTIRITKILLEIDNILGGKDIAEVTHRVKFSGTGIAPGINNSIYKLGGFDLTYLNGIPPTIPKVIDLIELDLNMNSRTNILEIKDVKNEGFKVLGFLFDILIDETNSDLEISELVVLSKH